MPILWPKAWLLKPSRAVNIMQYVLTSAEPGDLMSEMLHRVTRSSFFLGFARAVDLLGTFNQPMAYRREENAAVADAQAMANDWASVGQDLAAAAEWQQATVPESERSAHVTV